MRKKVIKNEGDELVTKGYLKSTLDQRFSEFEEKMDKKIDQKFDEKFSYYFKIISEDFAEKLRLGFEAFETKMDFKFAKIEQRFDRLEKRMWRSENWLSNHEDRILKLESEN